MAVANIVLHPRDLKQLCMEAIFGKTTIKNVENVGTPKVVRPSNEGKSSSPGLRNLLFRSLEHSLARKIHDFRNTEGLAMVQIR